MRNMNDGEIWGFLWEGTRTANIGTVRASGQAHVAPVWFVPDGRPGAFELLFTTPAASVKGRTLRRDNRVTVCVDDPAPPYSFVIVEGAAELSEDPGQLRATATRIGARYMGQDRAEEFGARNGVPGELMVRVIPRRVIAVHAVSD